MGTLMDLTDVIFRELDRLESADEDTLQDEIARAKEVGSLVGKANDVSRTIIQATQVANQTAEHVVIPRGLLGGVDVPTCAEKREAVE